MLIQVDVYDKDWTSSSGGDSSSTSACPPTDTLYASLATVTDSNAKSNSILGIGRKMGDILLSSDKSVSRQHSLLQMVTTSREKQGDNPGVLTLAATVEEKQACQEDCQDHQLAVVLKNVGKLGTYVVVLPDQDTDDEEQDNIDAEDANSDTDEDSDETDDDEQVSQKQKQSQTQKQQQQKHQELPVALSNATLHLLGPSMARKATLHTLEKDDSLCLSALAKPDGRVIIQCGKMGSTLVLQRKALIMALSGTSASNSLPLEELYKHGWSCLGSREPFDPKVASLVLTKAHNSSFKQVAAWCRHIPVVTPSFVPALLQSRKSTHDPLLLLPVPHEYNPTSTAAFAWTKQEANPDLWSSCTLLSTTRDDFECLAECAGSRIVQLYQPQDDQNKDSQKTKPTVEQMLAQARRVLESTPHCFGIVIKDKKGSKVLTTKLKEMDLPIITPHALVKCITEQRLPQTSAGKVIGRVSPSGNTSSIRSEDSPAAAAVPEESNKHKQEPISSKSKTNSDAKTATHKSSPLQKKRNEESPTTTNATNRATWTSKPDDQIRDDEDDVQMNDDAGGEEEPVQMQDDTTKASSNQRRNRNEDRIEELHDDNAPNESSEPSQKKARKEHSEKQNSRKSKTVSALKGWNQATGRQTKPREKIAASMGIDELNPVAETEFCNMLVRKEPQPPLSSSNDTSNRRGNAGASYTGPDFRTFRKNIVPACQKPWILQAVLPKETEQSIEYQHQQDALAQQQLRADELFRETAGGSRKQGRRRR